METFEFIVIGGGIAGASAAGFLAERGRTLLLEREPQPGYHSTGRSAALYSEAYGNASIRALTTGAKPFFLAPPAGFAEHPLLTPRGAMFIGRADQGERLDRTAAETSLLQRSIRRIDAAEARRICPALRPDYVAGAVLEPEAMDIDVHALHQGFLRRLRAAGGRVATDAAARGLSRERGVWRVATTAGEFHGRVAVNAAGAWADEVAALAGAAPVGLVPKRRTAILFAPPPGQAIERWPLVVDVDETFYFKPDAGKLIGSPADETPTSPSPSSASSRRPSFPSGGSSGAGPACALSWRTRLPWWGSTIGRRDFSGSPARAATASRRRPRWAASRAPWRAARTSRPTSLRWA